MADIRQAALWIAEGHIVKREPWLYEGPWDGLRKARTTNGLMGRIGMDYDDLLAEDWVIAEKKKS